MSVPRRLAGVVLLGLAVAPGGLSAAPRRVTVALDFSLTGADADADQRTRDGALLAIAEADGSGGIMIDPLVLDDGTATAGQYDPAQAATNARRMVGEPAVVAAIGPYMSGAAKAMLPILNEAGLAMISPATSSPDLTAPRYADEFRPEGQLTFFRMIASDAYQAPGMANYWAETLHVRSAFVLDDGGAYGVGIAGTFAAQAARKGIRILGRDEVDPKAEDYSAVMTRIAALHPDALYYGGVYEAGVKVIKQAYDAIPKVIKGGGDGLYGPEILTAAGFPAAEGWYITEGAPHLQDSPAMAVFRKAFRARFGSQPDDYSMTAYDAAEIVIGAIRTVAAGGGAVTRAAVRAAIARSDTPTLQGAVQFDGDGDPRSKVISIYQVRRDASAPADEMEAQFHYVGSAPAE